MAFSESQIGFLRLRTFIATVGVIFSGGCAGELKFSSFSTNPSVERIVLVPDTQCYARYFPEILEAQGAWLLSEKETLAIVGVVHLGDIVDTNSEPEWQLAKSVFKPVVDSVPTILLPGNHDYGTEGSADARRSLMADYFPPDTRFAEDVGDTYSDDGWNSWTIVNVGPARWLLMGLEFAPRIEVAEWAESVLETQWYDHAMVATHAYLGSDGLRYGEPGAFNQPFHPRNYGLFDEQSLDGEALWERTLAASSKTRLVVGGHVPRGFFYREVERTGGGETTELLVDYQQGTTCASEGGDGRGYLQVLEVSEADGVLDVRMVAYSPWLDDFAEAYGADFSFRN